MPTRENYLSELRERHRIHNTDFYKYIMAFSFAGLGFNLTAFHNEGIKIDRPFDSLEWSTISFAAVILSILLLFYLTAVHFKVLHAIHDPNIRHHPSLDWLDICLKALKVIAAAMAIASFSAAVLFTFARFTA